MVVPVHRSLTFRGCAGAIPGACRVGHSAAEGHGCCSTWAGSRCELSLASDMQQRFGRRPSVVWSPGRLYRVENVGAKPRRSEVTPGGSTVWLPAAGARAAWSSKFRAHQNQNQTIVLARLVKFAEDVISPSAFSLRGNVPLCASARLWPNQRARAPSGCDDGPERPQATRGLIRLARTSSCAQPRGLSV